MMSLLLRLMRLLPTPEWVLNHLVNKLPYAAWRMRAYQAFGVQFEDVRSGCLMLGVEVHYPRRLTIGRNTVIGPGALLDARGHIEIGANVNITGGVQMQTAKHLVQDEAFEATFEPIVVRDRAWVALGATVLGGATIGEGAVVAANSTVTGEVAPFSIVAGTPARPIATRTRGLTYQLSYRPNWT